MTATKAQLGYGAQLGRQGANLTTIALAITANTAPQAVTPASMAGIVVGSVLAIDTATPAVREVVIVTATTGSTFSAVFVNSHGTAIEIAPMVPLLEIFKLGGPNQKLDTKDATNMGSPNGYKEFIAALREGGEITFEGNYIPHDTTQENVNSDMQGATTSQWSVAQPTLPDQFVWYCSGIVIALSPTTPVDDRMTWTGTIKITGKPTLA